MIETIRSVTNIPIAIDANQGWKDRQYALDMIHWLKEKGIVMIEQPMMDQGWWPDGLLTPPSEEAMLWDMVQLKKMGFNMIRKHIKVEPEQYYYCLLYTSESFVCRTSGDEALGLSGTPYLPADVDKWSRQ